MVVKCRQPTERLSIGLQAPDDLEQFGDGLLKAGICAILTTLRENSTVSISGGMNCA